MAIHGQAGVREKLVMWGRMLRAARVERGLTQAQAALEIGVHRHTIRAIENGSGGVRMADWLAVAEFLDVRIEVTPPIEIGKLPVVESAKERKAREARAAIRRKTWTVRIIPLSQK